LRLAVGQAVWPGAVGPGRVARPRTPLVVRLPLRSRSSASTAARSSLRCQDPALDVAVGVEAIAIAAVAGAVGERVASLQRILADAFLSVLRCYPCLDSPPLSWLDS
jgi:hypothetical protein